MIRMRLSKFSFALKCLTTSIWLNFWLCNFCRQDRNFTHFCFRKVYLSTIARVPWLNKSMLTKYEKWSKADCYVSYHLNTIFVSLFDLGIFCIYSPRYILYSFTSVYCVFIHLGIFCNYSPKYILYSFTSVYFVFINLGIFCIYSPSYILYSFTSVHFVFIHLGIFFI